ncbi:hypothetical protein HDK64DRAFT_32098 [Phyllosticta capitalensis]
MTSARSAAESSRKRMTSARSAAEDGRCCSRKRSSLARDLRPSSRNRAFSSRAAVTFSLSSSISVRSSSLSILVSGTVPMTTRVVGFIGLYPSSVDYRATCILPVEILRLEGARFSDMITSVAPLAFFAASHPMPVHREPTTKTDVEPVAVRKFVWLAFVPGPAVRVRAGHSSSLSRHSAVCGL